MIGAAKDVYLDKIDELKRKHSSEYEDLRRFSRQLELTLFWLSGTLTEEQRNVVAAVRNGSRLNEAIKEYTETETT